MDSDELRIKIMENGSIPIIPTKSNSKRKNHGFKKKKYKSRHKVENVFADIKHFRGIATRYDKLKVMFEGALSLCKIRIFVGLRI
jgi:transposase